MPGARLWLHGIPGSGKIVMAGAVIQAALAKLNSDSVAVAFFFCDYTKPSSQDTPSILGALVSQIAL